jgi:hypothetical protein
MFLKKQLLTISVVFIMITVVFSSNATSSNMIDYNLFDSYLIQDVPYSPQKDFGCLFASLDMLFLYHGKNSSMMKNMFYNGIGYSYTYQKKPLSIITPPFPNEPWNYNIMASLSKSQGADDYSNIARLYGLNLSVSYPKTVVINHFKAWNQWWTKVKKYIKNDIPVCTGIDPGAWPIYLEVFNLTKPLKARGGHAIVIVGFNEKNRTICVQDPMAGSEKYYNPDRIGYQWISFFEFKRAMRRSTWEFSENSYWIIAVDDVKETPDFDTAFKTAHDRNIERLKGNKSSYDKIYLDNYKAFGMNAIKTLRDDYNSMKFFFLYPFYRIFSKIVGYKQSAYPFGNIAGWHIHEAKTLDNLSICLKQFKTELADENLTRICDHDADLLKNASIKFIELGNNVKNLSNQICNNTYFRAYLNSKNVIKDIVRVLDEIISIQQAIIDGPPEEI